MPPRKISAPSLEATVEARRAVVPLAGAPSAVAVAGEVLAEQHVPGRDSLACAFDLEQIAAGVQHRPARHADRAGGAAGDVRVGEGRAALRQAVEVRGLDLARAQGADRVEALVVREQDQDVRGAISRFYGTQPQAAVIRYDFCEDSPPPLVLLCLSGGIVIPALRNRSRSCWTPCWTPSCRALSFALSMMSLVVPTIAPSNINMMPASAALLTATLSAITNNADQKPPRAVAIAGYGQERYKYGI